MSLQHWRNNTDGENRSTGRKYCSSSFQGPWITQELGWDWTWANSAMKGPRISAWALAWHFCVWYSSQNLYRSYLCCIISLNREVPIQSSCPWKVNSKTTSETNRWKEGRKMAGIFLRDVFSPLEGRYVQSSKYSAHLEQRLPNCVARNTERWIGIPWKKSRTPSQKSNRFLK